MAAPRALLPDFQLPNVVYSNAVVTVYKVDDKGRRLFSLAPLYAEPFGNRRLQNPQRLDSKGRMPHPVYVDQAVILGVLDPLKSHVVGGVLPIMTIDDLTIDISTMSPGLSIDDLEIDISTLLPGPGGPEAQLSVSSITFVPTEAGETNLRVVALTNVGDEPLVITAAELTGSMAFLLPDTGPPAPSVPAFSASVSQVAFPATIEDDEATRLITITNTGSAPLQITQAAITAGPYTVTP